jgi:hypothetical protein
MAKAPERSSILAASSARTEPTWRSLRGCFFALASASGFALLLEHKRTQVCRLYGFLDAPPPWAIDRHYLARIDDFKLAIGANSAFYLLVYLIPTIGLILAFKRRFWVEWGLGGLALLASWWVIGQAYFERGYSAQLE